MSLALSNCVLFIYLMLLVNVAQFSNITFLLALFAAAEATAVFGTVIVPLTSIYASLSSHKVDLNIMVLHLI